MIVYALLVVLLFGMLGMIAYKLTELININIAKSVRDRAHYDFELALLKELAYLQKEQNRISNRTDRTLEEAVKGLLSHR